MYLFLERRDGRDKDRETDIHVREKQLIASLMLPTGDLARNPGKCPDQELNQWPFCLQAGTHSTEPHQPRLSFLICYLVFFYL